MVKERTNYYGINGESPNPAAAGKGAIAFLFHGACPGRALPEQNRWAHGSNRLAQQRK